VPVPFKPETHEADPHAEVMERFVWTVDLAGDAAWRTSIAEFLDLNAFIKRLAVENFLAEEDGLTGDYGPNNAYIYRFENSNRLVFIPWDKSNTFWQTNYWVFRNLDDGPPAKRNRLATRALAYPDLRELYLNTLLECAKSVDADPDLTPNGDAPSADTLLVPPAEGMPGWLEAQVTRQFAQVKTAALADPVKPYTNDEVAESINDLITFARERSANVRDQVAADRARRQPSNRR
jgi:hypothetical protein